MTNFFCLKSEHFLLLKKKRAILILRSSKRARHRPTRPTMRDAHMPFSHFSPNTPRKSRFGECFGLQPPLLVGGSSRRPIPSSATLKEEDAEDEEKRTKNAKSSLASLPIDVGVIIVSKLPVKSKAHLTMLENKELARWVRQGLFEESSKCAKELSKKSGKKQLLQKAVYFSPFREETSARGVFAEATDEDVQLYVKSMAERCEISKHMRGSLVAGLLNSSECGRRGKDRVSEMAKLPMGLRRLKQLTKATERKYAEVAGVEEDEEEEREDGQEEEEGIDLYVEEDDDEGNNELDDEDEKEFSVIEGDALRRECENLRAVVEKWSPEDIGETLAIVLEKELQTFRTTKEARDRTGEEEVRRMLEQEREKRRKKEEETDGAEVDGDEDPDTRDDDPFGTPHQFDAFHYNAPADYDEEIAAFQQDGAFENDIDDSDDEDTTNDERLFDWKIALDSICDARIYTFVHFCLGTPDFSHLTERIDTKKPHKTSVATEEAWKRIKIGVSKMIQVAFKEDIESEEKSNAAFKQQTANATITLAREEEIEQRTFCCVDDDENIHEMDNEDDEIVHGDIVNGTARRTNNNDNNNNDVSMDTEIDDDYDGENENGLFPPTVTNRVIVEKASALLALLTQHCATFQSVNLLDIPGSARKKSATSTKTTTNPAAFSHLSHFGDRGRENPFFESNMFATKIGGSCMMQHLDYSRGDDATMYFDQNISMTSLFMFGIEEDIALSSRIRRQTLRSTDAFRMGLDARNSSPMNDTRNVFDVYRDEIVTRLIEYWDDSFVLFFMARSAAEATNSSTKKRKRIDTARSMSSSRLSARRVSQRRTNSSPGVEKEERIIDNALRAFKTDMQQRFASWLTKSEEQKHNKTARIERNNARKFQKLSSAVSKLFQRGEIFQRDINRVTNYIASAVKSKDIWSLKNKIFNDAIETCAEEMVMVGCGDASCCPPKLHEVLREKVLKLAKIGYAAMSVIVEREDDKMNNKDPSGEIVVPHSWTL